MLLASGFDLKATTPWLAEGLVACLPADTQEQRLRHLNTSSAAGSQLALDRIVGDLAGNDRARLRELSERSGIDMPRLINTERGIDMPERLAEHGWDVDEQPTEAPADRYQRDLANPLAQRLKTKPATARAGERPWLNTAFLTARR